MFSFMDKYADKCQLVGKQNQEQNGVKYYYCWA